MDIYIIEHLFIYLHLQNTYILECYTYFLHLLKSLQNSTLVIHKQKFCLLLYPWIPFIYPYRILLFSLFLVCSKIFFLYSPLVCITSNSSIVSFPFKYSVLICSYKGHSNNMCSMFCTCCTMCIVALSLFFGCILLPCNRTFSSQLVSTKLLFLLVFQHLSTLLPFLHSLPLISHTFYHMMTQPLFQCLFSSFLFLLSSIY